MWASATTLAINAGLLLGSAGQYRQWRRATRRIAETQHAVLQRILRANTDTGFGREHRFANIDQVADYRRLVPLRSYRDFEPYIQKIALGKRNVLTAEPVSMFEPSSGSTAAAKLVPYTTALRAEFQRGINPWLYATFTAWPALLTGKQYWSITPVGATESRTSGGIPVGFEEDSQYFGSFKRRMIQALLAVPPGVRRIQDREAFRYVTLRFLLQCRDLSLVSVWNPTFLLLLLEALPRYAPALLADLAGGTLQPPHPLAPKSRAEFEPFLKRDPRRAETLAALLEAGLGSPDWRDQRDRSLYEAMWPRLGLISCWADGHAREYAARLQEFFPNTAVQPKGLIATEGFVSFPVGDKEGTALSLNSHFFEFIDSGASPGTNSTKLAHELQQGKAYSVVITTGGGLYRYQLHDLIEVTGFVGDCPLVRFLGKADAVVDLFGEKLDEAHVRRVATTLFPRYGLNSAFWFLAPERVGDHAAHYTLFLQWQGQDDNITVEAMLRDLADHLERGLQENYHYRYCRELGQLHPLKVFLIMDDSSGASSRFLETCAALGQRLGNVKPAALHSYAGWAGVFSGRHIASQEMTAPSTPLVLHRRVKA